MVGDKLIIRMTFLKKIGSSKRVVFSEKSSKNANFVTCGNLM